MLNKRAVKRGTVRVHGAVIALVVPLDARCWRVVGVVAL